MTFIKKPKAKFVKKKRKRVVTCNSNSKMFSATITHNEASYHLKRKNIIPTAI